METTSVKISARAAWWWKPAMVVLGAFVIVTGRMPSDGFIDKIPRRAIKVDVA
jgi:hypothetical protein